MLKARVLAGVPNREDAVGELPVPLLHNKSEAAQRAPPLLVLPHPSPNL